MYPHIKVIWSEIYYKQWLHHSINYWISWVLWNKTKNKKPLGSNVKGQDNLTTRVKKNI